MSKVGQFVGAARKKVLQDLLTIGQFLSHLNGKVFFVLRMAKLIISMNG